MLCNYFIYPTRRTIKKSKPRIKMFKLINLINISNLDLKNLDNFFTKKDINIMKYYGNITDKFFSVKWIYFS